MTLDEIRTAILADPTLKAMAIKGEDGDIAKAMTKPNTSPELTLSALMGVLGTTAIGKLINTTTPATLDFRDKVLSKDFDGLFFWASAFQKASVISTTEMNNINAELVKCLPNNITVTLNEVNEALKPLRNEGKAGQSNWLGG